MSSAAGKKRLGLIVNPVAGIGGRAGFKGSDGGAAVEQALARGYSSPAPERAATTLSELRSIRDEFVLLVAPSGMGETVAKGCGFEPEVVGPAVGRATTAEDTKQAARAMAAARADLVVFVGGDGTARDIFDALGEDLLPVLGVPAGVKIHSSVYAVNPKRAADLIKEFLRGRAPVQEKEVMDIDEDDFRSGRVSARLYGYLRVPFHRGLVQGAKAGSRGPGRNIQDIAAYVVDQMDDAYHYILGPGSTLMAIGAEIGVDKTLLGVDVVHRRRLVIKDADEARLRQLVAAHPTKIVVTVIGGQGHVFGRGNQPISPRVIRQVGKENIIIVAAIDKLTALDGPLLVDTGDPACDDYLSGYARVVTGYNEETVWKVEC